MKIKEAVRQLEKIQTLIEDLSENFPEAGHESADGFRHLEVAAEEIDTSISLLLQDVDEDEEDDEEDEL